MFPATRRRAPGRCPPPRAHPARRRRRPRRLCRGVDRRWPDRQDWTDLDRVGEPVGSGIHCRLQPDLGCRRIPGRTRRAQARGPSPRFRSPASSATSPVSTRERSRVVRPNLGTPLTRRSDPAQPSVPAIVRPPPPTGGSRTHRSEPGRSATASAGSRQRARVGITSMAAAREALHGDGGRVDVVIVVDVNVHDLGARCSSCRATAIPRRRPGSVAVSSRDRPRSPSGHRRRRVVPRCRRSAGWDRRNDHFFAEANTLQAGASTARSVRAAPRSRSRAWGR